MPRSARPGRGLTSSGGSNSGGIIKLLGALLGGVGGGAIANMPVDADVAPEFEGAFVTPDGKMVDQPFSSQGKPNFWDKIAGNRNEAADLNNQIRLAGILGDQSGLQEVITKRALDRAAIDSVLPMGEATTKAEINRRRSLIPVTEEETGSKNRLELKQKENLIPIEGRNTATQTYASRGIFPDDVGQLSALTAQNLAATGENQLTRANLVQRLMNAPENKSLFEGAALAEAAAPIGALRNALETGVSANSRLYRDSIGNATLDRLLNPGVYTGDLITRTEEPNIIKLPDGKVMTTDKTRTVEHITPGGFQRRILRDPNIENRSRLISVEPSESGIKTDPSAAFKVPKLDTNLRMADDSIKRLIEFLLQDKNKQK